ncbi:MAG: tRNA (adenosine(37)-N6)-threonylcarbamoyltransferase complex dimerization subunit type 1 TsaB [Flavobacterium sp.]
MSYILNIETSTKNCSVSIGLDGKTIALIELAEAHFGHAEKLHLFVEQALEASKITLNQLKAVAVSKGPGSYTGLRIGVSAAKGFAYSLNIPLISVDTLLVLAKKVNPEENTFIIPMLDARRMEVFTAVFDENHNSVEKSRALILSASAFEHYTQKIYCIGDCQEKAMQILYHPNIQFVKEAVYPSAKEMSSLSYELLLKNDFEDTAYFEPFYLKDFFLG